MPDYAATRSEYLKVMMGDRKKALAPYRPEQMNDLGDTSFDVASLSDEDINSAIKQMSGTQYEGTDVFSSLKNEQASRKEKADQANREKPWWEAVGDFFSNIGTSITEGVLNVVDDVWDFTIGVVGGIGGGWFGQQNDFTDWVADAMTDDRWVDYTTKALTQIDVFDKGFWTNEGGYWSDWSYENIKAEQERDYKDMDWLHKGGNFVGEIIPSLVLAYFTGGASLGVQAAAQAGLGLARGMGEAQSRALSEGASFQEAAGYGAVKGAISGALAGGLTYAGGTFASRGADSLISRAGNRVGDAILAKTGSTGLSFAANSATKFVIRVAGDAGEAAVLSAIEPALQQIYDDNAWYNAYGTEENRKAYAEQIGKAALTAAAFSAVTNIARDAIAVHKNGGLKQTLSDYENSSLERIAENEAMKSLSRSDRRLAREGAKEWTSIQEEINRVQGEYETMKAKGVPDSEIELFIGKNREAVQARVSAYSDKYGKVFTKLSAKVHPDTGAGKIGNLSAEKVAAAKGESFQKLSSMTSKGLKEQMTTLFNGKDGIAGLISYTEGSKPVETVKENNEIIAKPKDFEDVQSVLAAVASDQKNAPAVLALPLKGGANEIRLSIDSITPTQAQSIAFLQSGDFKPTESGAMIAPIGDGKSIIISQKDGTAEIVPTPAEEAQPVAVEPQPTEAIVETPSINVEPVKTNAEPSIVKEAANAKEGKVYSLSSAKEMVNAIDTSIKSLLELDNIFGDETKINIGKGAAAESIFQNLNLGTPEQQEAAREALRTKLLDTNVKYEMVSNYGEKPQEYTYTLKEMLSVLDDAELKQFNEDFDKAYAEMLKSGDESRLSKVISAYEKKLSKVIGYAKNLKASAKISGHIEKHRTKIVQRYYHGDVSDFAPGYDFDTQGFRILIQPLHDISLTAGKQSYTGSSVVKAMRTFIENYKMENFLKPDIPADAEFISVTELYNQGLRDLAIELVESIEANNMTVDASGKVKYTALDAEQLAMLRMFQDTIEEMPKALTKDRLESVSRAKSAYHGVERYVSTIIKNDKVGIVRNFIQGYAERYANNLDTLLYEIGDNDLTRAVVDELYLAQSKKAGMVDDFQGKINEAKKETGVTAKALDTKSAAFKDTAGNPIELKYLEHVYRHLLSGQDSNNVKYIEANTVHIKNGKGKLVHVAKFSYADLPAIESELEKAGLLDYSKRLHQIESGDLGDIYDEDYLRDTHIPNSNRKKDYTHISLDSNGSKLGKATIKDGVARYGHQKDRVDTIPSGVHLVIRDGEAEIMSQVANQANIHHNDPALKKINSILGTKIDKKGTTVKEYLTHHNPGALKLIERAIYGAYGIPQNKANHIIDFVGNGYVMTLIGMNPSSIAKQPISIMWSNEISIGSVLKFTVGANLNPKIWKNSTRLIEEIEKEFPSLRLRGKKNEALVGNAAADAIGKVQNAIGKVAGFGLRVSDAWTVGHEAVGLLSMQGQRLGYGEVGTPGNDAYVKSHYPAFYRTQVSSDKITMSGARAGYYGPVGKLTSFMTGAVQGQVAYLLRASQQITEYKDKTEDYYVGLVRDTKAKEEEKKVAFEEASNKLEETQKAYEEGIASKDEVKDAKAKFDETFEEYSDATGERADAETSAKGFKHYKEMGGKKGVIAGRLATLLITGITLTLISEVNSRLKGQKEWAEFDGSSIGVDLALNSTINWLPVVRDLVNAVKGYDLEIPEYAMVKQVYDLISVISKVAKDPNDKTSKELLRQAVTAFSAFMGIPVSNVWKYVYGITKTFSPATALKMNNLLYGASATSLASTAKEYAEKNDISTASDLYQSLYALTKTGEISREIAVEEAKLVAEGYNPIARNIPDYYQDENGERVYLSDDQRSKFSDIYAKANERVRKLVSHIRYKSLETSAKAKAIKKIYDLYYEAAKYRVLGIEPDSKLGKLLAYCDGDYQIVETLLLIQHNALLEDTKRMSKKDQAIRLVNQQPMTRVQKLLTLYLMGYGVNSENKKAVQKYLVSLGFTKEQAEDFLPSAK